MDVCLSNPVLQTMINVLSTMATMRPDFGKPSLKQDEIARGAVTGIMKMVSSLLSKSALKIRKCRPYRNTVFVPKV